jgi:hypothetical protein
MMPTDSEARAIMQTAVNTPWQASTAAIVGYVPHIYWPDVPEAKQKDKDKYYARFSALADTERQVTLSRPAKFQASGLLYVQVFGPANHKDVGVNLDLLAALVKGCFVGVTIGGVWFSQTMVKTMPADALWANRRIQSRYYFEYFAQQQVTP